jgi:hypothetical protein
MSESRQVEPHGFTAVVPFVPSAEPAEACLPLPRLRRTPARIPPRLNSRGFLRRRVKNRISAVLIILP